jgi:predicted 2-oxoglutarate/Fe(II)-dependent dioxygenase YbiX
MKELLDLLEEIEKPGDFCTSGTIEPCFPGLEVSHVGSIGFPLTENQAKEIIQQCSQAPYGRGEQTIVDTKVRSTWQLEPQQFQLKNPEWDIKVRNVVEKIKEQFGLTRSSVSYELYKCLLYEKGDFFSIHRDTEKSENMFATLVIVLPSEHEGGELIVYHEGEQKKFSFGKKSQYNIQYAAFYADCKHEVTPVTQGYRLCLIYNLALSGKQPQPLAPKGSEIVENVTQAIKTWASKSEQDKLAILLEHHYTQAGLSFYGLKGPDRAKAQILVRAALAANCKVYLGLITLWESGAADAYDYDDYSKDADNYEMEEVFDQSLTIDTWVNTDDKPEALGEISINEDEIIAETSIGESEPDEQEIGGYTGNEGITMDRWYHRAAIIIWPEHVHFRILCQAGQEFSVPQLKEMVQKWRTSGQNHKSEQWQQCQLLAREIIKHWATSLRQSYNYLSNKEPGILKEMFNLLITIGDIALIKLFLKDILSKQFSGREGQEIILICQHHGWTTFQDELSEMVSSQEFTKNINFVQILEQLCLHNEKSDSDWLTLCQKLSRNTIDAIKEYDVQETRKTGKDSDKIILIESLFKALSIINETTLLEDAVKHFINETKQYQIHQVLIPVLKNLFSWIKEHPHIKSPYLILLEYCIVELKKAVSIIIEEPKDWMQYIKLSCKCADCQQLQSFLTDPETRVSHFRVKKERRQHLHNQINTHVPDMTHVTQRKGSPYTLVCTKTRDTYHKQLKQREVDIALLEELDKIYKEVV